MTFQKQAISKMKKANLVSPLNHSIKRKIMEKMGLYFTPSQIIKKDGG